MANDNKITKLGIYLLIIMSIITIILMIQSPNYNYTESEMTTNKTTPSYTTIEVYGDKKVLENRVIATDKYVQNLNQNKNIVVVDSNNQMYIVKSGRVLAGDVLVVSDENNYDIIRVNDPEKSIYYNK